MTEGYNATFNCTALWKTWLDQVVVGDALTLLQRLPAGRIALTCCSPPYFQQRRYTEFPDEIGQEATVEAYVDSVMAVFEECLRVTHENGSIVFNLGDKYVDGNLLLVPARFALRARDKATLINEVTWVKKNPTPRQYKRRLSSATEKFYHFVKGPRYHYDLAALQPPVRRPASDSLADRCSTIGDGYLKIIAESGLTDAEKINAVAALRSAQNEVRTGRIHSIRMKIRGKHSLPFGGQEGGRKTQILKNGFTIIRLHGQTLHPDYLVAPVETIRGIKHPAVYPRSLVEKFVKLTTRPGDVVLDPFAGSGTTCLVSKQLGRHFIGFDLCSDFVEAARQRVQGGL